MFLTPDQIQTLTGYRRADSQKRWLDQNQVEYYVAASGRPVVPIAAIGPQTHRASLSASAKPESANPSPSLRSFGA